MNIVIGTKKSLKIKGIIGSFAAIISIASYLVYYICYYNGIKYDEIYFISTGLSISIFTGLLFTFFDSKIVRTFLLFASTFYIILICSYICHWFYTGFPYAYIKISLFSGLIVGLIYFIYDTFITNDTAKDRHNGGD